MVACDFLKTFSANYYLNLNLTYCFELIFCPQEDVKYAIDEAKLSITGDCNTLQIEYRYFQYRKYSLPTVYKIIKSILSGYL